VTEQHMSSSIVVRSLRWCPTPHSLKTELWFVRKRRQSARNPSILTYLIAYV
jgi:hypothetical protein